MKSRAGNWESGVVSFITTQWTVILEAAGQPSSPGTQAALEALYRAYWPPVYAFIHRRGYSRAEAQDLSQDFFLYLLEQNACAKADSKKGKFRSFLIAWLKNFLGTAEVREKRQKRGGDQRAIFLNANIETLEQLETKELKVHPPLDEEREFELQWASILVKRALEALSAEYATGPKKRIFTELKPFLQGGADIPSQAEVSARLGISLETLRSHLSRLRARYRQILREEVMRTVPDASDVDEELRYLCKILIGALPEST